MRTLRLGYSPCPNDTFLFYALVHGRVDPEGLRFEPVVEDVETLNRWALEGRLPVTKVSCGALGRVRERYWCLRSGGAMGWGCGPLVVARERGALETFLDGPIAVPGAHTTASLLLRLRAGRKVREVPLVFHEVMPAVADGRAAAGVVIHEGRLTYAGFGLEAVEDLGAWWERETSLPIPLGAIAARRDLAAGDARAVERVVRRSVEYALARPEEPMEYVRRHAREMDEAVLQEHIRLYVNRFSADLGEEGERALAVLLGRQAGLEGRKPAAGPLFLPPERGEPRGEGSGGGGATGGFRPEEVT